MAKLLPVLSEQLQLKKMGIEKVSGAVVQLSPVETEPRGRRTLLDLFDNPSVRTPFLEDMAKKVIETLGLQVTPSPATHPPEAVDIRLSRLDLRQTFDTQESRRQLIGRATSEVKNRILSKGIAQLSREGIIFEAQYDVTIIGYHLVGQIWY